MAQNTLQNRLSLGMTLARRGMTRGVSAQPIRIGRGDELTYAVDGVATSAEDLLVALRSLNARRAVDLDGFQSDPTPGDLSKGLFIVREHLHLPDTLQVFDRRSGTNSARLIIGEETADQRGRVFLARDEGGMIQESTELRIEGDSYSTERMKRTALGDGVILLGRMEKPAGPHAWSGLGSGVLDVFEGEATLTDNAPTVATLKYRVITRADGLQVVETA